MMKKVATEKAVSFSDLMLDEAFKEAITTNNEKVFKELLFLIGFDTEAPYEVVSCLHRNAQNKAVDGPRLEGYERLDDAWIKSGYASQEAIIASSPDDNLRHTLRKMSKQVCVDKGFNH